MTPGTLPGDTSFLCTWYSSAFSKPFPKRQLRVPMILLSEEWGCCPSTTKVIEDKDLEAVWRWQHLSPKATLTFSVSKSSWQHMGEYQGMKICCLITAFFLCTRIPHRPCSFWLQSLTVESHCISTDGSSHVWPQMHPQKWGWAGDNNTPSKHRHQSYLQLQESQAGFKPAFTTQEHRFLS